MVMGAAPMGYVLWKYHMKHNPRNPEWIVMGINTFGASAPSDDIIKNYGFTLEEVIKNIKILIKEKEY